MKVMIVDDTTLVREAIGNLLRIKGHRVVAEAANGREAVQKTAEMAPDLILMDVRMPGLNGVEATRIIKTRYPQVKIVMLTVSDEEEDIIEAIKCGADGYLLKDMTADELFHEVDTIEHGGAVISKDLAGKVLEEFKRIQTRPAYSQSEVALSPREIEILKLVKDGLLNREMAEKLFISENTVKYHMKRILEKLQVENRSQVVAWATRHMSADSPR